VKKTVSGKPAVVYMAVNIINGKRYIGVTTKGIQAREKQHYCEAMRNDHNGHFHRAIRAHGVNVFVWSILKTMDTIEEALKEEVRLIEKFKPEYNSTKGGDHFPPPSPETIAKIKAANTGHKRSLGRRHSDATKAILKERALAQWERGRGPKSWNRTNARQVVCLDDGRIYESASAAARHYELTKSLIISVCNRYKNYKTAGDLVFRYYGDHLGGKDEADAIRSSIYADRKLFGTMNQVPVICLKDGMKYRSYEQAAKAYDLNPCKISLVCRGKRRKTGGMEFAHA